MVTDMKFLMEERKVWIRHLAGLSEELMEASIE